MANTAIYRTLAESGSGTVCTLSVWFKKTFVGVEKALWGGWRSSTTRFQIRFKDDDTMDVEYGYSSSWYSLITDRVFRDTGAWMHVVLAVDSTQATPADREKLYINGVQETSFSTENYMPQNYDTLMTASGDEVMIGCSNASGSAGSHQSWWKGDMSWAQFVDGAQLAPTEFGEVDATSGIWKIKTDVYGTPGTTGFCLKMEDRTNLDLDSSSNAFTFSTEGTLTPTYDNPSNNFATLNSLAKDIAATYAISNGNTTVQSSSGWWTMPLTLGVGGGKWYFEAKMDNLSNYAHVGWATADQLSQGGVDSYFGAVSVNESACGYGQDGSIYYSTTTSNASDTAYGNTYTTGDVIGCALDLDNGFAYWSKNGTWQNSGVPTSGATGTGAFTIDNPSSKGYLWLPGVAIYSATWSVNAGNGYFGTTLISSPEADDGGVGAFAYDVPEGYRAVCTKNIKAYGG